MKVIILQNCQVGNVNDVVEVKPGFAYNFLFKKKLAIPFNQTNQEKLNQQLTKKKQEDNQSFLQAKEMQKKIENVSLTFHLKEFNGHIRGSITKKQIVEKLKLQNIILPIQFLTKINIHKIGSTILKLKLHPQVMAKLKIEVINAK